MTTNEFGFDEYQIGTAATAKYPGALTGDIRAVSYLGLGLGEAGEIQGKLKKVLRDDNGVITPEKVDEVKKELGDLLWYVARLADELGLSLEVIAKANLDKLADRANRGVIGGSGDDR